MYTIIDRRKVNRARVDETAQAAQGGPSAPPRTGGGGEAASIHRLGDG